MSIRTGEPDVDLRGELDDLIDEFGLDHILSQLEDICRSSDGYDPVADDIKTARQNLEVVDEELRNG